MEPPVKFLAKKQEHVRRPHLPRNLFELILAWLQGKLRSFGNFGFYVAGVHRKEVFTCATILNCFALSLLAVGGVGMRSNHFHAVKRTNWMSGTSNFTASMETSTKLAKESTSVVEQELLYRPPLFLAGIYASLDNVWFEWKLVDYSNAPQATGPVNMEEMTYTMHRQKVRLERLQSYAVCKEGKTGRRTAEACADCKSRVKAIKLVLFLSYGMIVISTSLTLRRGNPRLDGDVLKFLSVSSTLLSTVLPGSSLFLFREFCGEMIPEAVFRYFVEEIIAHASTSVEWEEENSIMELKSLPRMSWTFGVGYACTVCAVAIYVITLIISACMPTRQLVSRPHMGEDAASERELVPGVVEWWDWDLASDDEEGNGADLSAEPTHLRDEGWKVAHKTSDRGLEPQGKPGITNVHMIHNPLSEDEDEVQGDAAPMPPDPLALAKPKEPAELREIVSHTDGPVYPVDRTTTPAVKKLDMSKLPRFPDNIRTNPPSAMAQTATMDSDSDDSDSESHGDSSVSQEHSSSESETGLQAQRKPMDVKLNGATHHYQRQTITRAAAGRPTRRQLRTSARINAPRTRATTRTGRAPPSGTKQTTPSAVPELAGSKSVTAASSERPQQSPLASNTKKNGPSTRPHELNIIAWLTDTANSDDITVEYGAESAQPSYITASPSAYGTRSGRPDHPAAAPPMNSMRSVASSKFSTPGFSQRL